MGYDESSGWSPQVPKPRCPGEPNSRLTWGAIGISSLCAPLPTLHGHSLVAPLDCCQAHRVLSTLLSGHASTRVGRSTPEPSETFSIHHALNSSFLPLCPSHVQGEPTSEGDGLSPLLLLVPLCLNAQLLRPMLTLTSTVPFLPRLLCRTGQRSLRPSHRQAYSLPRSTQPQPQPQTLLPPHSPHS